MAEMPLKNLLKVMASRSETAMPTMPSVGYVVILRRILRYPAALWTPWERQWMKETLKYLQDKRKNGK